MRFSRLAVLLVGAACGLAPAGRRAAADDPDPKPAPDPKPDGPKPDAPKPEDAKPVAQRELTKVERAEVEPLLHSYLIPDSEQAFRHRLTLLEKVKALQAAGCDLLLDLDQLTRLIYASRTFAQPVFAKKNLPKAEKGDKSILLEERDTPAQHLTSVVWDRLRLTLSTPRDYPLSDPKKVTEHAPWPLILTFHEKEDFEDAKATKPWPGEEVIKRRYDPVGPMKPILSEWLVVAPVVAKAKWLAEDGRLLPEALPPRAVWQRYHVDFDRFVLDGKSEALSCAATFPNYYAGVIVRGDEADVASDLVRNFASLSVYVVGSEKSAALKSLRAGGFPMERVKVGAVEGLPEWLKGVHRTTPTAFHWAMKNKDMSLANWVSINSTEEGSSPTMDVEAVRTAEDPNTVRIKSRGVRGVTVFLSDRILDLDKPVRIVANGQVVANAIVVAGSQEKKVKFPAKTERNFDSMFDGKTVTIRKSQYYGWLYPVTLDELAVTGDDTPPSPPGAEAVVPGGATAGATPAAQAEHDAQQYFEKAQAAEKAGDLEKAKRLYQKAIAEGETTVRAKADAKLKELEKNQDAPKGSPATK